MKPAIPLTDPRFVYTPALETDLRATFARIKKAAALAKAGIPTLQPKRKA